MRKSVVFFLVLFSVVAFFTPQASLSAQVILKKPLPLSQQNQASITAIIPRAISIQQGGPSAVVAVDGKYLETILSVQAIRGGQGFGEISVKLVQPWPASRKIELQAGANAPVAKGYQLRVIGKTGLKEFKFDIPLAVFSLEVAGKKLQQLQIPSSSLPNRIQMQTFVTSASPQKVMLVRGGDAIVVRVNGTNLAMIDSVQVTRAGAEIQGISEALDKSQLPMVLKISLKASVEAKVASDYLLTTFDASHNKLLEIPGAVLAIEVRAAELGVPDIEKMILDYLERNPDAEDTAEGISEFWQQRKVEITFAEISYTLEKLMKKGLLQTFLKADGKHYYKLNLSQQNQALILSITPKAVSLDQGGSPAVVTVDGKYLETILSMQVMRGGRVANGISAKLVQPWPASRKLELQAGARAPVAQGYQLRVIGKAGLKEFKFDIPLAVFSLEVVGKQANKLQVQVPLSTLPTQEQTLLRKGIEPASSELRLTRIVPDSGDRGSIATIMGNGFLVSSNALVYFTGWGGQSYNAQNQSAPILAKTNSSLKVKVPPEAVSGKIEVRVGEGASLVKVTSAFSFVVMEKPSIESISPMTGYPGLKIEIRGYNFQDSTGSRAQFKFFDAVSASWNWADGSEDTDRGLLRRASVTVPNGAKTGPITVLNSGGSDVSKENFQVTVAPYIPTPVITSFTPKNGNIGTEVTLSGKNFGTDANLISVKFGNDSTAVHPNFCSNETIRVNVPTDGETWYISVLTSSGKKVESADIFYLPPEIRRVSPNSAPPEFKVIIFGKNLYASKIVKFNGIWAQIDGTSRNAVDAYVPNGATTGLVTVESPGGTATSPEVFTVVE
ncbi:MAG: IPT/TIG domain-containing protein [Thermodesulfovibrionales bacterium]|nr:IPT/TIG domain-containing protein [Thermodesulfovibrionales bacterium]